MDLCTYILKPWHKINRHCPIHRVVLNRLLNNWSFESASRKSGIVLLQRFGNNNKSKVLSKMFFDIFFVFRHLFCMIVKITQEVGINVSDSVQVQMLLIWILKLFAKLILPIHNLLMSPLTNKLKNNTDIMSGTISTTIQI